jgi:hypothetical protein
MKLRLAVAAALLLAPCSALAQDTAPQVDLLDLWRMIRNKPAQVKPEGKPAGRMIAAMPIIGRNPTSGLTFGVAGQVAFVAGDPKTTRISSAVMSLSFSTKNQILLNVRFDAYTNESAWLVQGDNRVYKSGEGVYGLGTDTATSSRVDADYSWLRLHDTIYRRLHGAFYGGAGLLIDSHTHVKPSSVSDAEWNAGPYVTYSQQHGLPTSSQQSAGLSLNALFDRRVGEIDPRSGWMVEAWYQMAFKGFMSGDSNWRLGHVEARGYIPLTHHATTAADPAGGVPAKHRLTFWGFSDLSSGVVPYFDLPTTVSDTYGRSARAYVMGRYRGEKMVYGEAEYRSMLTANGLLGLVVFTNVSTVSNTSTGERLFDNVAPAAGAGLRALFNKRSRTNLCVDFAVGKAGAKGVYLAIQDAF